MTEVVGCVDENPAVQPSPRVQYQPGMYGYDAAKAKNKFVRMRLNNAILPLDSIQGGACAGRPDGLCPLDKFLESQAEAEKKANYQYACFANYTIDENDMGKDYDGTIS